MTTLILVTPYLAFVCGVAMMARALHFLEKEPRSGETRSLRRRLVLMAGAALAMPTLAQAQQVDLRTAAESGNAIIMYLSGSFAAIGIVAAGVAMMMGRQSIAKWAFAGAMVSGLSFAIVRTMWSNMGLEAAGVSSFSP
jgi:type IV secretory pathway VirB2 component (pilin)